MEIRNHAQLKRAFKEKRKFRVVKHFVKPDYEGQIRIPNIVQTNGMYTQVEGNEHLSNVNWGKGLWCDFGKASEWTFENGKCTYISKGIVCGKEVERPIWTIEFID